MRAASSVPMANQKKPFQSKIIRNASHTENKIDSLMMGEKDLYTNGPFCTE